MAPVSAIESTKHRLEELICSTGAYQHSPEKQFRLASGKTSEHYFDLRLLNGDPEGIHTVARMFYQRIKEHPKVRAVGGLESGSISIATAISQLSHLENKKDNSNPRISSFFVRKQSKQHGTKKLIEGKITSPVIIMDDVITSGQSAIRAIDAVKEAGHDCECLMSIIFRGSSKDRAEIEKHAPLEYIFSKERFTKRSDISVPA